MTETSEETSLHAASADDLRLGSVCEPTADLGDWPSMQWPDRPVRIDAPPRIELLQLRALIVLAVTALLVQLIWLCSPSRVGDRTTYIAVTVALSLRAISWLFEWYNYWTISIPPELKAAREWTVDILTTACPGEPAGMIVRTLMAMKAIHYPHTNYLCDEGDDPYLKSVCASLGVVHVTRSEKKHAKAGNINNALTQATGEIAIVLDPDHEPAPFLIDRVLGYFEDPEVGFVQSVQAYRNQSDSFVARAAAEQTYNFYGPYMMGTNGHGTTSAIGANCVFRRTALDSIGGHAAGLSEDMHTAMRLYAQGWKSVYVPEILTRGLVPSTLGAYFKQQIKWACGTFDLLFQASPTLSRGFTFRQKVHYFLSPLYYLRGVIGLLEMVVPILCLTYGLIAWRAPMLQILVWFLPLLVFGTLVRLRVQRWLIEPQERGLHFAAGVLTSATWWVYLVGFACAVFRIKIPYIPTPKEDKPSDAWNVALPNFVTAGLLLLVVIVGIRRDSSPPALCMAGLASLSAWALIYVSIVSQQVTMQRISRGLAGLRAIFPRLRRTRRFGAAVYGGALKQMREGWLLPGAVVLATVAGCALFFVHSQTTDVEATSVQSKDPSAGGFYTGIDLGNLSDADRLSRVAGMEQHSNFQFRIVSMDQSWGDANPFPWETMKQLRRKGSIPLLNWLPTLDPATRGGKIGPLDRAILKSIRDGVYDNYVRRFADETRAFGEPVLITFAPQADNPQMPWSRTGGNTPDEFVAAWRHIVTIFNTEGAANAGWIWVPAAAPTSAEQSSPYFPGQAGKGYVDWKVDRYWTTSVAKPVSLPPQVRA
jgi:cellulose synthase (UDP-forming)